MFEFQVGTKYQNLQSTPTGHKKIGTVTVKKVTKSKVYFDNGEVCDIHYSVGVDDKGSGYRTQAVTIGNKPGGSKVYARFVA